MCSPRASAAPGLPFSRLTSTDYSNVCACERVCACPFPVPDLCSCLLVPHCLLHGLHIAYRRGSAGSTKGACDSGCQCSGWTAWEAAAALRMKASASSLSWPAWRLLPSACSQKTHAPSSSKPRSPASCSMILPLLSMVQRSKPEHER